MRRILCIRLSNRLAGVTAGTPAEAAPPNEPAAPEKQGTGDGDQGTDLGLLTWCRRYSPLVGWAESENPDSLLLDVTGWRISSAAKRRWPGKLCAIFSDGGLSSPRRDRRYGRRGLGARTVWPRPGPGLSGGRSGRSSFPPGDWWKPSVRCRWRLCGSLPTLSKSFTIWASKRSGS